MRVLVVIFAMFLLAGSAGAAEKRVTLFLDGARVEQSHAANGGFLEISLPAGMKPGSLRLVPQGATRIERVDVVPARLPLRVERELARLVERRERLQDRLQALKTREGVFTAAAKAQSGKAPRKTKTNPEPLQSIRKGTDFALAQLEEVYSARRSVEKEMAVLTGKESALRKEGNAGGSVARVWLSGRNAGIRAIYLQSDLSWTPRYAIRLGAEGTAEVTIHPRLPAMAKGTSLSVALSALGAGGEAAGPLPVRDDFSTVATMRLPVQLRQGGSDDLSRLALTMTNSTATTLPGGDAACFREGVYTGGARLTAIPPRESREIVCGE